MRIKVKKQLRLDELIKYIFDSGIEDKNYGATVFNNTSEVRISGSGNIKINGYINKRTTFTVEVEEELTEETEFDELWESYWNSEDSIMMTRSMSARMRIGDDVVSINGIKSTNGDIFKTVAIFYKDTLIWSAESGIPESGVLEVDDE